MDRFQNGGEQPLPSLLRILLGNRGNTILGLNESFNAPVYAQGLALWLVVAVLVWEVGAAVRICVMLSSQVLLGDCHVEPAGQELESASTRDPWACTTDTVDTFCWSALCISKEAVAPNTIRGPATSIIQENRLLDLRGGATGICCWMGFPKKEVVRGILFGKASTGGGACRINHKSHNNRGKHN